METRNLIDGQWRESVSGRRFEVRNPATDEVIAAVPMCGAAEARAALDSAFAFQPEWEAEAPDHRAGILERTAALMAAKLDSLANIITLECGKPLAEARLEVQYAADYFSSAAHEIRMLRDVEAPLKRPGVRGVVRMRGIGVCAAITPWNFPLAMLARKAAPALAAGCVQLAKPAEETPLSSFALAEILLESELPPRCLHVLTGEPREIAAAWLEDGRVRKLSFTGSTETGRILLEQSAKQLVRCSMELGGHAAFLVLEDADLDLAVQGAVQAKFRNAGQTCICPNRFLVHHSIAGEFGRRVALAAASLKVAPGMEEGSQIGPLINEAAVAKVRSHVADAMARGGKILCGGKTAKLPDRPDRFFQPTVIAECNPDMLCYREETFGPVVPIMGVGSPNEAIEVANSSPWGLAGYVFGASDTARHVAEQLQCGVIGVNEAAPSNARAPFGGVKWSGFGREGGVWGLMEYVATQYLAIRSRE
ncbi:MAG: NAD-dependent succinate-semialdehyde dehydrogenase [Planctomycetes bacterium]|nr:NAD-dependent succinate-semialdehyde dehydrogenase [Planctomycetota bacterium]